MNARRLGLLLLAASGPALAEPEPRWEAGIGTIGFALPDYRGSREISTQALPFPYIIYRGRRLKADRDGLRGILFDHPGIELNISSTASLATDGENNPLREGMPVIDPTFELGPALNINLTGESVRQGWRLHLPVRAVYAFNSDGIDHVGSLVHPQFSYRNKYLGQGWRMHWTVGVLYADEDYHDYYYTVEPQYARPDRPAYDARRGYSGFSAGISFSRRQGRLWYGGFLRFDELSGAAFVDSPLVETENYFNIGFGVAWVLGQSDERD